MHWIENAKIALTADNPADIPKVQELRRWISRHWYPRHRMNNIPGCHETDVLTRFPFGGGGHGHSHQFSRNYKLKRCSGDRNPGIISSFEDITVVPDSTERMLAYMQRPSYGVTEPSIMWAITFAAIPGTGAAGEPGDWDYSIRMNMTFGEISSGNLPPVRPLVRGLSDWYMNNFQIDGFTSMQLLVDRYIIHRREALGAASVLSIPARMVSYAAGEEPETVDILAEPLRWAPLALDVKVIKC